MTTTTYYNLNIVEGTDVVNPLTVDNPNYEKIDETLHDNAVAGVTLATEVTNATVHAIARENSDCAVIRFIATSEWKAGDTATVDGVPVTALLPSGETLPDGAYVINANVLCILTGTNLTFYLGTKKAGNANEITYNDTNVGAELDRLNVSLQETNSNLNLALTYNEQTDYFGMEYNGEWKNVVFAGFKSYYLYYNGNEMSQRTGGWTVDGYSYKNIAGTPFAVSSGTKNTDYINLDGVGSNACQILGVNNLIDLTKFKSLKVKVIGSVTESGVAGYIFVTKSKALSGDSNFVINLSGDNTFTFDMSSLTGLYYIAALSSNSANRNYGIEQIWLE